MERLDAYRRAILELIKEHARFKPSVGRVRPEIVCDRENDHYELMYTGWIGPSRVHGSVIHIDIRDGKVWIEHNGTEAPIATQLVEAGIAREDIVLGFHPEDVRPHTGFAVG